MITSPAFSGKKYAVLGLARSGIATVRALLASGAEVVAWDDNDASRQALWEQLKSDRQELETAQPIAMKDWLLAKDLNGYEAIVVSPGVPINRHPVAEKAKRYGLPLIGDIELFALARPTLPSHKVVGITGTNGKSTTTALVHHILKTAGVPTTMGGNIGLPILAQDPLPEGGVYVLELSSYQIDLTYSLDCDVAVLLNITPDHLDRYDGFEGYVASKERLFTMQSWDREGVFAVDDPVAAALGGLEPVGPIKDRIGFSYTWHARGSDVEGVELSPSLQGPHNAKNAAAALHVARHLALSDEVIAQGLRTYPGLPHRMERVAEHAGVLYVNDSKATNATATAPALAAYPLIHWILGGLPKSDDLDDCAPHFNHVKAAYVIGEAGPMFARILGEAGIQVTESGTLDQAVRDAAAAAKPGEVVLLSPACASFDQFKDYEARGQAFRDAVGALG